MTDNQKNYVFKIAELLQFVRTLSVDVRLFIGCQFALESNFGTSQLAMKQNNHCGMKIPEIRLTTNNKLSMLTGEFAGYASLKHCILDYVLWLQYNKIPRRCQQRVSDFCDFLVSRNYCPESDYVSRIHQIYNQFNS